MRKTMVKDYLKNLAESAIKSRKERAGDQSQMDIDGGEGIG